MIDAIKVSVVPNSERTRVHRGRPFDRGPWASAFRQIRAGKTVRITGPKTPAYIYARAKREGTRVHVSKRPRSFVVWADITE